MIDVINKKCIFEGCIKTRTFNLPSEKNPIYCFEHKKDNMINIRVLKTII